jgi:hypothetical protein
MANQSLASKSIVLENVVTEGKFVEYKMKEIMDYTKDILSQKRELYDLKSDEAKVSLEHQIFDITDAYEKEMTSAQEEYEKTGNNQIMIGVTATDTKYKQRIKEMIDAAMKEEYEPITEKVRKERERKWLANTERRRREFLATPDGRQTKQQHNAAMRKQAELKKDRKISVIGKMQRGNNYSEQLAQLNDKISKLEPSIRRRLEKKEAQFVRSGEIQKQRLRERYQRERDSTIEAFERRPRKYDSNDEQHTARLEQIDENEKKAMIPIDQRTEEAIIYMKEEYILHGRLPEDIESENENENESIPEQNINLPIEPIQAVKEKSDAPNYDNLYIKSILHQKIAVPFVKVGNNMPLYFKRYASRNIEGKCRKEGYIRPNSMQVVSYSTGLLHADNVLFDVVFSCDICYPCEDMIIKCKIVNITKIGIRGIISELNNPIVLFISREHNANRNFEDYEEGNMINIKVLGVRFELNDEYISVIGEII